MLELPAWHLSSGPAQEIMPSNLGVSAERSQAEGEVGLSQAAERPAVLTSFWTLDI